MLSITMQVENGIAKQCKCQMLLCLQNLQGIEVIEDEKLSLHCFPADQKIVSAWKKCSIWHPIVQAKVTTCYQAFSMWAFKNAFKTGTANFTNSLSLPSTEKKVCTGSKSRQGT